MSFDDRLRHSLVIYRNVPAVVPAHDPPGPTDGDPILDDYGQPVMGATTVATVRGLIQPRSAKEIALTSQAGAVIGTHVGYMRPLAGLTTADWIEHDGVRFDILSMPDAAGLGHHLELALQAVT